ncbi:hypothetical protein [Anabaena azotica]|uniref:Uncharacterized protein n=1 Tax=Anabaena azotica FACHB-119 TaxID=947527 RepID=A0ABR8D255_9NOST|nr:hypothetical protein [Anabaena azotica]MBD2501254.1 hypothetical protein [Anabaena azotica FACHB-119]
MYPIDRIAYNLKQIIYILNAIKKEAKDTEQVRDLDNAITYLSYANQLLIKNKEQKSQLFNQNLLNEYKDIFTNGN